MSLLIRELWNDQNRHSFVGDAKSKEHLERGRTSACAIARGG